MLQDEIKNQSVSCATMRPEDLIPSFIDAVKVIDPDNRPLAHYSAIVCKMV